MADKKEINEKELEHVSGGNSVYYSVDQIRFNRVIGQRVEVNKKIVFFHQCTIGMIVTKRGYVYFPNRKEYEPCYYLEAIKEKERNCNGWWYESTLDSNLASQERMSDYWSSVVVTL